MLPQKILEQRPSQNTEIAKNSVVFPYTHTTTFFTTATLLSTVSVRATIFLGKIFAASVIVSKGLGLLCAYDQSVTAPRTMIRKHA